MRNIRNIQVKNYKLQIPFISYRKLGEGKGQPLLPPVSIWVQIIDIILLHIAYHIAYCVKKPRFFCCHQHIANKDNAKNEQQED